VNILDMMKQASRMKERVAELQQELAGRTVEGSAGGGAVTVTANGKLEILSVRIAPSALADADPDLLGDLVRAATNQALGAARELVATEMNKIAGGLGLPFPGM
jgi:DNA-binding YbaB/EbfC family protein